MTRRQVEAISRTTGPYHPARLRRIRGWTIVDDAGRIAYTEPNPTTGRPRPAMLASLDRALAVADRMARHDH